MPAQNQLKVQSLSQVLLDLYWYFCELISYT